MGGREEASNGDMCSVDEEDFPFMGMPLSDLDICEDGWEREGKNCGDIL